MEKYWVLLMQSGTLHANFKSYGGIMKHVSDPSLSNSEINVSISHTAVIRLRNSI